MREAANSLAVFRGLPPGTIMPESVDVTVLNGSGVTGQAADTGGALGRLGFNVVDVDSVPDDEHFTAHHGALWRRVLRSVVRLRVVASYITGGASLEHDPSMGDSDGVVVIVGTDFTTIHDQPAPEGSPDDERTTTSTTATTEGSEPSGDGTTTTVPEATTTTVIGYSTGEPPDGVDLRLGH